MVKHNLETNPNFVSICSKMFTCIKIVDFNIISNDNAFNVSHYFFCCFSSIFVLFFF